MKKAPIIGGLIYSARILVFATSKYLSSSSIPMNLRPVFAQAAPGVPLFKVKLINSFHPLVKLILAHCVLCNVAILAARYAVTF